VLFLGHSAKFYHVPTRTRQNKATLGKIKQNGLPSCGLCWLCRVSNGRHSAKRVSDPALGKGARFAECLRSGTRQSR
jgi:hypothetical protein